MGNAARMPFALQGSAPPFERLRSQFLVRQRLQLSCCHDGDCAAFASARQISRFKSLQALTSTNPSSSS